MASFILISTHNGNKSNLFITESYDPTSHIESTSNNVLSIYQRIFGKEFDLTIAAEKKRSWRFHNYLFLIISIWIFYYINNLYFHISLNDSGIRFLVLFLDAIEI